MDNRAFLKMIAYAAGASMGVVDHTRKMQVEIEDKTGFERARTQMHEEGRAKRRLSLGRIKCCYCDSTWRASENDNCPHCGAPPNE